MPRLRRRERRCVFVPHFVERDGVRRFHGLLLPVERRGLTPLARRRVGAAALGPGRGPRLLLPELVLHRPRRVDRLAQALLKELVLLFFFRGVPRQTLELAREVARRVARPLHVLLGSPCIIRGLGERRSTLFERMRRVARIRGVDRRRRVGGMSGMSGIDEARP